jgi:hypothetical protein
MPLGSLRWTPQSLQWFPGRFRKSLILTSAPAVSGLEDDHYRPPERAIPKWVPPPVCAEGDLAAVPTVIPGPLLC